MDTPERALRIVQWTTGNVARQTVRAIVDHPHLELAGVFAHSEAKVGRDASELVGLDVPTGVLATGSVDELLDLAPDCVVYTPLHFDVDEVAAILQRGINVVTTAEFLTGHGLGEAGRAAVERAAQAGGASIFGSGMNPGFAQLLAAVSAGICARVRHVRMTESFDVTMFAADHNMDALGWGRPEGSPGHVDDLRDATLVFSDAVDMLAGLLGVALDDRRCTAEFAHALVDLDLPGRPIAAGTVAGIDLRWEGLVGGEPVIELRQTWVMGDQLDRTWPLEHGYLIEIDGEPKVRTRLEIWPHQDDLAAMTAADFHALGMIITGLPVVHAIVPVCEAAPGIRTYDDLRVVTPRGVLEPLGDGA